MRTLLPGLLIIVILLIAASALIQLPPGIGDIDFVQYWSSARALFAGSNPYDAQSLESIQRVVLPDLPEVTRMWNPPGMLTLAALFSLFPFEWARSLWWFSLVSVIVLSFFLSTKLLQLTRAETRYGMVLLILSAPVHSTLAYGQLPPFLLLGWVLSLVWLQTRPLIAGCFLSLTLLKPHLLFLDYLLLLKGRCFRVLFGAFAGGLLMTIVPFLFQSEIFSWYIEAVESPPLYWFNSSLGAWSQFLGTELGFPEEKRMLLIFRFLPAFLGVGITSYIYWERREVSPVTLMQIAPWSLACSPYGWTYDQLLLLPTQLLLARHFVRTNKRFGLALLIGASVVLMLIPGALGQSSSVWYPLFLGILALQLKEISLDGFYRSAQSTDS